MKRIFKEQGAIVEMARHFHLSEQTVRRHLRDQVRTTRTREILDYANTHYTYNN